MTPLGWEKVKLVGQTPKNETTSKVLVRALPEYGRWRERERGEREREREEKRHYFNVLLD
jgi:hypothetical protein